MNRFKKSDRHDPILYDFIIMRQEIISSHGNIEKLQEINLFLFAVIKHYLNVILMGLWGLLRKTEMIWCSGGGYWKKLFTFSIFLGCLLFK